MPVIQLETIIKADIDIVFDLARSIDLHLESTRQTRERVVAGRAAGLITMGETVTWEAVHFGIRQRLTSRITAMEAPFHFRDEMEEGAFRLLCHDHYFATLPDGSTSMKDEFRFESPYGVFGRVFNKLILTGYLHRFLEARNGIIKARAEIQR